MSKKLQVPALHLAQEPAPGEQWPASDEEWSAPGEQWSLMMDSLPRHLLDQCPWPAFPAAPATHFAIAHTGSAILLKFFVDEDDPRVTCTKPNDPVYKDSCVEFFLSFDNGGSYYNMEWNAAGVCLMMHGPSREERTPSPPALIRTIGFAAAGPARGSLAPAGGSAAPATLGWSLTLYIPTSLFIHDKLPILSGTHATANFYKCGDDCPEPHYLAWNHIGTPTPDFHQPRYFGQLVFL